MDSRLIEGNLENDIVKSSLNPECTEFIPRAERLETIGELNECFEDEENVDIENIDINSGDEYIDDEFHDMENSTGSSLVADSVSIEDENNSDDIIDVCVAKMIPSPVMLIPVKINGVVFEALLDTGATNNLVKKEVISKLDLSVNDEKTLILQGLGNSRIETKGAVILELGVLNRNFKPAEFHVLESNKHKYDILLGEPFLRENKFIVNMSRMQISFNNIDGSREIFYMTPDGKIDSVMKEKFPVVAGETIMIDSNYIRPVKVNVDSSNYDVETERKLMYFTGLEKKKCVRGVDGILEENQDDMHVLLLNDGDKRKQIREGEILGYINTIFQVETDEETVDDIVSKVVGELDIGDCNTNEEKQQIYDMIRAVQAVFGKDELDIGRVKMPPHSIELTDSTPIWQRHQKFPEPVESEIEGQCEGLMSRDIISISKSSWSSRVVPVRKKNGELRLCVDYRKLNSVTKSEKFPMPNLADSIYSAHNMRYFTRIDLIKGYYQIELDEASKPLTAFSTSRNHYHFNRVSFGLKNSGIAFQRAMQHVLTGFSYKNVIIYIDDVLIMNENFEEHLELVKKVLVTLAENGIKIKADKCEFFKQEVTFLGHVIGCSGIRKSPEYMLKVRNYPKPKTVKELRQFLGLVNFQCKFVDKCSVIAKPLSILTGGPKKKVLEWSEDMDKAFETLKDKLVEDVELSFPDYREGAERLELFVDASSVGTGGCLVQKQNGIYRTIGYSSMTFDKTQARYSTIERELVAIRWGLKTFRPFIYGIPFILYTDHKPLVYLQSMSHECSRLMRTFSDLAEYDFEIKYRPGKDNEAADAMSRIIDVPSTEEYEELVSGCLLPKGLKLIREVKGGGDSMFVSLKDCFDELKEEKDMVIPESALELRRISVELLLNNSNQFGMKIDRENKKRITSMKYPGCVPCEEILLAVCELYRVDIWVHYGMKSPVVYRCNRKATESDSLPILHLQCVSGVHFNPVRKVKKDIDDSVDEKMVNTVMKLEYCKTNVREVELNESEKMESLVYTHKIALKCSHPTISMLSCGVHVDDLNFCAIVDTGAEVSLVDENMFNLLKRRDDSIVLKDPDGKIVRGIDRAPTALLGTTELKLGILGHKMNDTSVFAVVRADMFSACCLLGANFIRENCVTIDFEAGYIYGSAVLDNTWRYPIGGRISNNEVIEQEYNVEEVYALSQDDEIGNSTRPVKFTISNDRLNEIQKCDFAIKILKQKIESGIPARLWKSKCIGRFKHYVSQLQVMSGLLVRVSSNTVPVVPFRLLVEIVYKTHNQMAHIGRDKLVEIISRNFWHPGLESVARELCSCCEHCQLYKVAPHSIAPPMRKIKSYYPYDLVAMDVTQYDRSARGNIGVLMVVDHFSKHLIAVPVKNKKAETIVRAVKENVLPYLMRIPRRILTDNGSEFLAKIFEDMLDYHNIEHLYSSPYHAPGNGAVERSNRTITEFLKGLIKRPSYWDIELPNAVIVYNSTVHSALGQCPSDFLLKNAHNVDDFLPIDVTITENWREGHPSFAPFKVNQKVVYKRQRIGNRLCYKFEPKYDGPFVITKMQSNGVSYEMRRCDENDKKLYKAHHTQLKKWNDSPKYVAN